MDLPFGLSLVPRKPTDINAQPPGQRRRVTSADDLEEIGATGTTFYGGFLDSEEYNKDLQGEQAIKTYRTMAASDGTIKAMLRILSLPMRSAQLEMEPASDSDDDKLIAEATLWALQHMQGQTWDDFVRQAFVGSYTYGFAIFEPVYETPEHRPNIVEYTREDAPTIQLLAPYKFAPRLQKTIWRWLIDETGTLRGVQQLTFVGAMPQDEQVEAGDSQISFGQAVSGTIRYKTIPAEKLFVLTLDQEGSNYRGESVLRSAYKHWFYKGNFERMLAVGIERHLVGTPYAILRQGIQPTEQAAIVSALKTLRSHEKAYLVVNESQLADGQKVGMPVVGYLDMPTLGANGKLANEAMTYQDRQMVISILADFLSLGSGMGGNSNVMHRDKTGYFFLALQGYAQNFLDAFTTQVIRRFVDYNFPNAQGYPTPKLLGIETKDTSAMAASIAQLAQAGALTLDPEIEQFLRDAFGLPLLDVDNDGMPMYPGTEPVEEEPSETETTPTGEETTPVPQPSLPAGHPAASAEGPDIQQLALNGTQVTALLEILQAVTENQLAPDTAKGIIKAAFPTIDEAAVNAMVDSAKNFTPEKKEPPPGLLPFGGKPSGAVVPTAARPTVPATRQQRMIEALRTLVTKEDDALELQNALSEKIKGFAQRLADSEDDEYDQEDFRRDSHSAMLASFGAAFLLGTVEMQGRLGTQARQNATRWAQPTAVEQEKFLIGFSAEISSAEMSDAERDARATMYAGQVWTGYQRGKVSGMPDNATIVWHASGDEATCDLCNNRDGATYTEDDLPGFPGEGEFGEICEGGPNCRCFLEMVQSSEELIEHRILSEARCPKCAKLIAKNVNLNAELACHNRACRSENGRVIGNVFRFKAR